MVDRSESSGYVDYEAFLVPDFRPADFANRLVLATNTPNDIPLDLSTPLSRVLFDAQEVDSHIESITSRNAVPLLTHAKKQQEAGARLAAELDEQLKSLNDSYAQLERDVILKHAEADQVRHVASRLWEALRLARAVARCLQLGRQLQFQLADAPQNGTKSDKEDPAALVRAAHTVLNLREVFESNAPGEEAYNLDRIRVIQTLQKSVVNPACDTLQKSCESIVREFSLSTTDMDSPEATAACEMLSYALGALYLISPTPQKGDKWSPALMLRAVEQHVRSALQASLTALGRGLAHFNGQVPLLEKSLQEVTARCRTLLQLEKVLKSAKRPRFTLLTEEQQEQRVDNDKGALLQLVLNHFETGSLVSYFWRTLAGALGNKVHDMAQRGSPAARSLRTNWTSVEKCLRDCVLRGCELPDATTQALASIGFTDDELQEMVQKQRIGPPTASLWDREVAVMVGSVVNNLGR